VSRSFLAYLVTVGRGHADERQDEDQTLIGDWWQVKASKLGSLVGEGRVGRRLVRSLRWQRFQRRNL
jgi:hypothetical protein